MIFIKKALGILLLILLVICVLQFMAVNPQPIVLVTLLGNLPAMSIAQAVLGSWLLGMMMGLMWMMLRHSLRAKAKS